MAGRVFMLALERPDANLTHHTEGPLACTQTHCQHRALSEETYNNKHASGCTGCQEVVAELGTLSDILRRGETPLIRMELTAGAPRQTASRLTLEPATKRTPYVAISHVWSDSLGNPRRNSILSCQFQLLCKLTRALPRDRRSLETRHFWLDTLCVPPDGVEPDAQRKALNKLRNVYEEAAKEGALAKSLFFQFRARAHDIDEMYRAYIQRKPVMIDATLGPSIKARYQSLRGCCDAGSSFERRIGTVINTLRFRTTSEAADEGLCIAALLERDVNRILGSPADKRMEELCNIEPESGIDGAVPGHGIWLSIADSVALAEITQKTLQLKCPGIVFDVGHTRLAELFITKDTNNRCFTVRLQPQKLNRPGNDIICPKEMHSTEHIAFFDV
ncbi:hypothetical protein BDW74DRAFT_177952 [Aspergillus multicolor]|uniref:uncharacterized protein n=1 Tax=Aspergillus multicolor TaxID=41759 RepID=UPI003CCD63FE